MTNKQTDSQRFASVYLNRQIVLAKAVACIGTENQTPPPLQEFIVSITTTVKPVIKANCEEHLYSRSALDCVSGMANTAVLWQGVT